MRFQLDASLVAAAERVAQEMIATGAELTAVKLGAPDDQSSLTVATSHESLSVLHTFVVEGTTFYLGITRPVA